MKLKLRMYPSLILAFLMVTGNLFAGDLRDQYYETRSQVQDSKKFGNEEGRKQQLERTLTRSLRLVMLRKYQYEDYDKITSSDFEYEKSDINEYTYFVKYQDYVGYFSYSSDPQEYYTMPRDYRIYKKPQEKSQEQHEEGATSTNSSDEENP